MTLRVCHIVRTPCASPYINGKILFWRELTEKFPVKRKEIREPDIKGKSSPTVGELIVLRKKRTEELEEILATSDAGRPLPRRKERRITLL